MAPVYSVKRRVAPVSDRPKLATALPAHRGQALPRYRRRARRRRRRGWRRRRSTL